MFSEYASRFLAQSQSRLSFRQPENDERPSRNPLERRNQPHPGMPRPAGSRSYLQRAGLGNPYQIAAPHMSQFPFASRTSNAQAPLFYSTTDEFREEDDEEEHQREVADFYALQRSRRQFGGSHLEESSEGDEEGSRASESGADESRSLEEHGFGRARGIKSSWRGGKISGRYRKAGVDAVEEEAEGVDDDTGKSESSRGKGRLVDIGLESELGESLQPLDRDEAHPPDDLIAENDDDPPPFQQFRKVPADMRAHFSKDPSILPYETDPEAAFAMPHPPSSTTSSVPPNIPGAVMEPPRHDSFWGTLYLISLASLFATFLLVYLHTSPPSSGNPLGDTIYTTLHSSFHLLAVDTLIAVIVSLLWLALLRSYVRPLVYLIVLSVPIILTSFTLYPLISSYKGTWHGNSIQDKAMRWLSWIPFAVAALWTYSVYRGRHSLGKAIGILEWSCRILAANPALLLLGFATLAGVVLWTWSWMGMFTRVFLGGHFATGKTLFIIDIGTWWIGVCFVLVYLWTLSVGSGIQRATTAATVSQWYFHRNSVPAPSSRQVVQAALSHSTTTLFGTISLSGLLSLLVRLPLILLPRRLTGLLAIFNYSLIPTSIIALTNPLTLTYASIHSQPLSTAARGLSNLSLISSSSPATALHPRVFASRQTPPLLPYRLAKLLLHATRFIMSLALGFGGWVSTARMLVVEGSGVKGSLYAYVVGLIAGAIGWGVLGAMEGVLGGVVDAGLVCWGSEVGEGRGEARYCREAGWLFGEN